MHSPLVPETVMVHLFYLEEIKAPEVVIGVVSETSMAFSQLNHIPYTTYVAINQMNIRLCA